MAKDHIDPADFYDSPEHSSLGSSDDGYDRLIARAPSTTPTPGPWSFSPATGVEGHGMMAQVWGPDGRSLASIDRIDEHAAPNARLIAAAPELLTATTKLTKLIDTLTAQGFSLTKFERAFLVETKALLARIDGGPAEGGETP